MKKKLFSLVMVIALFSSAIPMLSSAAPDGFGDFQVIIDDFSITGSSVARDVAVTESGRYALVLLSDSPSAVTKVDLLTKEIIKTSVIRLSSVKAIEIDDKQDVFFVTTSTDRVDGRTIQNIYIYSLSSFEQVGIINYETPVNDAISTDKDEPVYKAKQSNLYNMALKTLGDKTYLYTVHQGTGWHTKYPLYKKDDTICRIDVTDYSNAVFDEDFGKNGYLYLEDIITDGDPAALFDIAVKDNGDMLVLRQSDNNDKISVFLTDPSGVVLNSKFIKYAKYVQIVDDIAIISQTGGDAKSGGQSIKAIDFDTLEYVDGVLPSVINPYKYAGAAYDAKNNILYVATDDNNVLLATGEYTESTESSGSSGTGSSGPSLPSNGNGISGYFPYAYFYGYEGGAAGAEDPIKREEAAALLFRILKQQELINVFKAVGESYSDVQDGRWSYSAIEYMKSIGVFEDAENIFPNRGIDRSEIAKMITLSLGYGTNDSKSVSFTDLTVDHPNYVYLKAIADNDIFIGYGDSTINPDGDMTRGEFVTTINRLIQRSADNFDISSVENLFSDIDSGHWAYTDIMLAANGFSDVVGENNKYSIDSTKKAPRETIDYN